MMVLTKFVNIKVNNHSMEHYKELGYDVKMFDEITIPVEHLTPKSTTKIVVKCDYCGAEYEIRYADYTRNARLDSQLGKPRTDACVHCRHIKAKGTYLDKYGVDNPMKDESVRNKAENTNVKKYGVSNPILNTEINQKRIDTLNKKYGVDNPMKLKEIAQKQFRSMLDDNNKMCSKCQKHISELYNGVVNYSLGRYSIDVYIEKYNVAVEINGSGHNMDVVLNKVSEEQFCQKESTRIFYLSNNGIKQIIFVLEKDKLPNDNILLNLLDFAITQFSNGSKIIYFLVDKNKVLVDSNEIEYDYKTIIN